MKHFALIGRTLTHSLSKEYFDAQHFADADYTLCPMPSLDGLRRWVQHNGIGGFNVTVPYKQAIIPHLDALSPEALSIGAVNCVTLEGGRLVGHNTDAPAFRQSLQTLLHTLHLAPDSAFILGTGGAAHAVAYALGQLDIPHRFVSRTPAQHPGAVGYSDLPALITRPSIIVNATPVGMYPDVDSTPLIVGSGQWAVGSGQWRPENFPFSVFSFPFPVLVYDLVYNPSPTLLMRQAAALGAQTKDGLEMLHLQAELSWHLWHLK